MAEEKALSKACLSRLVGLIPAAGSATRISPLPFSKELYPIGFGYLGGTPDLRPKVVCHYLLENMRLAGVTDAFIILREGKWDIPSYFKDGNMVDMNLGYLVIGSTSGVPYTLDFAYPFVRESTVLLGFPDILFRPKDAFAKVFSKLERSGADIVLGLFPTHNPQKADMVELQAGGRVKSIQIKPKDSLLKCTWGIAAWTPAFTKFMHDYVSSPSAEMEKQRGEVFVGHVIQAAVDAGMAAETVMFENGAILDIGTSDDLLRVLRRETSFDFLAL